MPLEAQMTISDSQRSSSRLAPSPLIAAAWLVTLLASTLPDAIWYQFIGTIPLWLFWGKVGLLIVLVFLTWAWKRMQALRFYFILLFVNIMTWWLVSWIRKTPAWSQWEEHAPWSIGMLAIQLLKIGVALLTLVALFILMRRRQSFFLVKGQLDAKAGAVSWLGIKDATPWKTLGPIIAVVAAAIMTVALLLTYQPSMAILIKALPFLPAALLFAVTNAFSEEVSWRSSLLAPLHEVVGKSNAMLMTAVFFGLAHYFGGVPLATLPTILMTGFLGWLMGKSMLETKGFFWAWFIHFISDIPVFFFLAMNYIVATGK